MKIKQFRAMWRSVAVLALLVAFVGGCSKRYIQDVTDHGSKGGSTIVQTLDTRNYVVVGVRKQVFWECREGKDTMICTRVCDRKDEQGAKVLCPKSYVWPW